MTETSTISTLADQAEREAALDTSRSFLVQAPAGSGKTELLTRRFLKLLSEVEQPEEVLAITFTRSATAEMRSRVVDALAAPSGDLEALAAAALANADRRQWRLVEQPQRLNIQTIDSLCLSIALQTPILSRLGGSLAPVDDAEPLYRLAARRTLSQLGGGRPELSHAIRDLLAVRDSNLADCEDLIAGMLHRRDQWGRVLSFAGDPQWNEIRKELEAPFLRARARLIKQASNLITREAAIWDELIELIHFACGNLAPSHPSAPLLCLQSLHSCEQLGEGSNCGQAWLALRGFLLTKDGKWRRKLTAEDGFPRGSKPFKERFAAMISILESRAGALELINGVSAMPPAGYSPEQWALLEQLFIALRHAVAELRVVFAEENKVDFVEVGLAAREALQGAFEGSDAAYLHRWRHLLVDEFQDTSRAQFELFELLVKQWGEEEGPHTCFLVGDPMQSIYGFRNSEVELFEQARRQGLAGLPLDPIVLQTNFRTHAGLVVPLNEMFDRVFGEHSTCAYGAVSFRPSTANLESPASGQSLHVKAQFHSLRGETPGAVADLHRIEAEDVVTIVRSSLEKAPDLATFRMAVLARRKKDLWEIARELRIAGIPFHAVELEDLGKRQEVLDLVALTRALLHPLDRVAWLSVLRAPWCGLSLLDLHMLCGADEGSLRGRPMLELLRMRLPLLTPEGSARATRTAAVLEWGIRGLAAQPSLSRWIERVWRALGGSDCVSAEEWENVRSFLLAIEDLSPSGAGLAQRIERLCAQPDPRTCESSGVQLMTIHKAKGLGFDTVIVPGLHSGTRSGDAPLLLWLERTNPDGDGESELLVCPIGVKGAGANGLYGWIQDQKKLREREEAKRLLYVACTRARAELHLMGVAGVRHGSPKPDRGSLLEIGWPGLHSHFLQQWIAFQNASPNGAREGRGSDSPSPRILDVGSPPKLTLRRMSAEWAPADGVAAPAGWTAIASEAEPVERPHGGLRSRAAGVVIHALLEEMALRLAKSAEEAAADTLLGELEDWKSRAVTLLRHQGLAFAEAASQSHVVLRALRSALADSAGRWILSTHEEAEAETSWSRWKDGALTTLRGDRTFLAGAEPLSHGRTHRWIVDYKTASHGTGNLDAFLEEQRSRYRPQLQQYADVFRAMGSALPFRLALYYPLIPKLICLEERSDERL